VLFDHASTAAPITLPAHSSLFTGRFPPQHGVRDNGSYALGDDAVTLAKILNQAGYDTAYVGKWHMNGRGRSAWKRQLRGRGCDRPDPALEHRGFECRCDRRGRRTQPRKLGCPCFGLVPLDGAYHWIREGQPLRRLLAQLRRVYR